MFEFTLPDVGEGVAEGELVEWHVDVGDEVAEDQVLAEVETDKAVVDLPSPVAGTVEALHAEAGDVVPVGEVIVTIDPDDEADANVEAGEVDATEATTDGEAAADESTETAEGDAPSASPASGRVFAPPSVRRQARELGVDLAGIVGSGPGGRITASDVREAAGASGAADADVADAITQVAPESDVSGSEDGRDDGSAESEGQTRKSAVRRVDDGDDGARDQRHETAAAADRERTLAAPATRRLADDLDVDLDAVPTDKTRDGEPFVERADVEAYADAQRAAQAKDAVAVSESEPAGEAGSEASGGTPAAGEGVERGGERREPYTGVRRTIGEKMAESAYTAPHVSHHDTAVVTALVEAREAMKPRAADRGISLTYLPFVLKAVVAGLRDYPVMNSSLDEENEEVVYKGYYDLGVATATDAGLMVPVVRSVDEKSVLQLASEVNEVTEKARERSISLDEMRGGTFTVTNFGTVGGEYATPIINYPETAILGLGSIEQRPVVVDSGMTSSSRSASGATASGEVEARHTLPLSLSIDHRVIDGAEAARFTNTVIEYLENPSLLLLE